MQNVGSIPVISKNGLLSTICYRIKDETNYALEGAVEIAGAALEWAKDTLRLFENFKDFDDVVNSVSDEGGVMFI